MKKAFCIFLSVILMYSMLSISQPATAEEHVPLLSEMTESECLAFIKANGITLPPLYENESSWGPFVKKYITLFESNPDAPIAISYTVTAKLAQNIKTVVNRYYGTTTPLHTVTKVADNPTWLVNSELYGEWEDNFEQYNCYAYAVDYPVWVDPGKIKYIKDPSLNILDYSFNIYDVSIEDIVNLVKGDLQQLGHQRLYSIESQINTDNLCTNEKIICVRKGYEDYHFMRYTSEGWLHKPAGTHILKYKYTPTDDRVWTNENVYRGVYSEGGTKYDSTIYFISYDGHDWSYSSNSSGTHTMSCSICSDSFTYNCSYRYTYLGDNLHSAECIHCDYTIPSISCSISRTSNGDGTHTATCTTCGHTSTESCTLQYINADNTRHLVKCTKCNYQRSEVCDLSYTTNNNGTHKCVCNSCGNDYTRACGYTSEYQDPGQHQRTCVYCDYSYTEDCYSVNTYCGDGNSEHIHKKVCETCDHVTEGTSETCTFAYKSNGENTHVYACTQCRYVKSGPTACAFKSGKCLICGALKNSAILNAQEEAFSEN